MRWRLVRRVGLVTGVLALGFVLGRWSAPEHPAGPLTDLRAVSLSTARVRAGAAAEPVANNDVIDAWTTAELRAQYRRLAERERAQAAELLRLREAAAAAGQAPGANRSSPPTAAAAPPGSSAEPAPSANPLEAKFYPADPAELAELAKTCTVRVDHPPVLDSTAGALDDVEDKLQASPAEARAMRRAVAELHRSFRERLRKLFEEVVGHAPNPELSSRALLGEIYDKTPAQLREGVMGRISKERAGQAPPPSRLDELSPYERATRLDLELGDEFQTLLTRDLGAPRARALRSEKGGWPWQRSIFSGCE